MTILGLLAIIAGLFTGLSSPIAYNGQWLLGVIISLIGLALVIAHATITIERNKK